jgi:hypothetical protein
MNRLRVCILFFGFAVIAARAEETNTPAPASATSNAAPSGVTSNGVSSSITIDGTTYQDVRWGRLTPSTVTIFHRTGIATIPLWKLPPALQKQFGYDPQKAADWQKRQEQMAMREQQRATQEQLSKTLLSEPLKVGMVGVSRNGEIHVIQVVGTKDMRANISTEKPKFLGFGPPGQGGVTADYMGATVGAPVFSNTEKESSWIEVWITGISTQGLIDGTEITRKDVFKITGTKTYRTAVGGTATIFVMEPLTSMSPP